MLAVIKRPQEEPEMREIDNTLQALQAIVDGPIETLRLSKSIVIIVNKEGRLRGMQCNSLGFAGPMVCVGHAGEEFRGLTEAEAEFLMDSL